MNTNQVIARRETEGSKERLLIGTHECTQLPNEVREEDGRLHTMMMNQYQLVYLWGPYMVLFWSCHTTYHINYIQIHIYMGHSIRVRLYVKSS